jgi:3-mercaptopyruvate sulfurtransferase SseA
MEVAHCKKDKVIRTNFTAKPHRDCRSGIVDGHYRGGMPPGASQSDTKANRADRWRGHIPGAKCTAAANFTHPTISLFDADQLRRQFDQLDTCAEKIIALAEVA